MALVPRFELCYSGVQTDEVLSVPDGESGNGEAGVSPALSRNCNPARREARSPASCVF